ncbi:MAG: response regulator transcription factor [Crocinitomicaceae bacterium]|nr:response regulator transcription factor [Crocinitomicaceae bacterium]
MENRKHILLVEDDASMGFLLKDSLENYEYKVTHISDGESALVKFRSEPFDLCLLDVMMPNMDGFSLAEEIRKSDIAIPIIFLTAKSMKEDRIKGFKIGADDYVTKPFSVEELTLRMAAIFKRGKYIKTTKTQITFSNLTLDVENLVLINGEQRKQLTKKESDILELFVQHQNTLLKREFILKSVWKDDSYFVGRSLDVFISKLRKYFKDHPTVNIVNVHGSGYRFEVSES